MTRTPPKLTRPTYHVWLLPFGVTDADLNDNDPEDLAELDYQYVVVNHADQLRAELEAKRQGLGKPQDTPMHLTSLWLWASLVRTGRYAGKFAEFKTACIAYDPDKEPDPADTEPDPTEASTG
jgi:hypothetical protein